MKIMRLLLIIFVVGLLISCSGSDGTEVNSSDGDTETKIIPVEIMEVRPEQVEWSLDVVGLISANIEAQIPAEVAGQVKSVNVELGSYVKKGDILFKIDDEYKKYDLTRAESQKMIAKADYEKSELDYQRYKNLYETKDVSEFDLENMRLKRDISRANSMAAEAGYNAAKKQFNDTSIKAPFDGFISKKFIDIGDMVGMGAPVGKIIDIELVKIKVEIAEIDIPKVKVGQIVKINLDAYSGQEFRGKITAVSPEADEVTKTFPVEIKLRNTEDFKIKPGMIAKGKIIFDITQNTYLLPQDLVYEKEGKHFVFVDNGNVAVQKEVKTGREYQNMVEIIQGVSGSEKIITTGSVFLKDGSKIEIK